MTCPSARRADRSTEDRHQEGRRYRLTAADGSTVLSERPGQLGGHRRLRIYGRLDCPSALRWLARGHYARFRVFFADEATARAAGYRPCARCMPAAYALWRQEQRARRTATSSGIAVRAGQ